MSAELQRSLREVGVTLPPKKHRVRKLFRLDAHFAQAQLLSAAVFTAPPALPTADPANQPGIRMSC
jgi:hypothetical protein